MPFNFESIQLAPYREYGNNGLRGALYYIKPLNAICILNPIDAVDLTDIRHISSIIHRNSKRKVAIGLPAALLANKDRLWDISSNPYAFYRAFQDEMAKTIPDYPAFIVPPILDDWIFTLDNIGILSDDLSSYFDMSSRLLAAQIIRSLVTPYKPIDDSDILEWVNFFTYRKNEQLCILCCSRPENSSPPSPTSYVLLLSDYSEMKVKSIQASGIIAAIIKCTVYRYWQGVWDNLDFTHMETLQQVKTFSFRKPVLRESKLEDLRFYINKNYQDFFDTYIRYALPHVKKALSLDPTIPLECWDGDNVYSYIYVAEGSAWEEFGKSEMYASLHPVQIKALYAYYNRFLEFMVKKYPINQSTVHQQMNARMKDMPPIQLQITTNTEITRKGYPIPTENHYGEVIRWLEQEKNNGRDYFAEAEGNRSDMCRNLTSIFGWVVDENSLQKAQNRKKKNK